MAFLLSLLEMYFKILFNQTYYIVPVFIIRPLEIFNFVIRMQMYDTFMNTTDTVSLFVKLNIRDHCFEDRHLRCLAINRKKFSASQTKRNSRPHHREKNAGPSSMLKEA